MTIPTITKAADLPMRLVGRPKRATIFEQDQPGPPKIRYRVGRAPPWPGHLPSGVGSEGRTFVISHGFWQQIELIPRADLP